MSGKRLVLCALSVLMLCLYHFVFAYTDLLRTVYAKPVVVMQYAGLEEGTAVTEVEAVATTSAELSGWIDNATTPPVTDNDTRTQNVVHVVRAAAQVGNVRMQEPLDSERQETLLNRTTSGPIIISRTSVAAQLSSTLKNTSLPMGGITSSFSLDDSFHMPFRGSVMPSSLQSVQWAKKLKDFLQHLPSPHDPVVLVTSDNSFKPALINWLISSQLNLEVPLENVLVVTYDEHLCLFLAAKQIHNCLSVPISTLMQGSVLGYLTRDPKRTKMTQLLIIRVSVMRILNRWGFDTANFDSDAIILKNPVPLFEQYPDVDIVGTNGGALPKQLLQQWGMVLCMGAILVRSTPATEALWDEYKKVDSLDDQRKMNFGLHNMHIKWKHTKCNSRLNDTWEGKANANLRVFVLPQKHACRGVGCQSSIRPQCYIWHKGRNRHKFEEMKSKAQDDNTWYLKSNWPTISQNNALIGLDWLRHVQISERQYTS